ncbi:MAG: hypothetical protein AAFV53_37695 [Myxococcota bacterium]
MRPATQHGGKVVGFTGARAGMTPLQLDVFARILQRLQPTRFVHGDCIGADADAHAWIVGSGLALPIRIRPSTSATRAWSEGADEVLPPRKPMLRNRDIVDDAELMVACSPSPSEILRSGTWAAIRYARKKNKPLVIIWPDGSVAWERL